MGRCWSVGGSEFVDFDVFDEINDFYKSASLRGSLGRGSRNRRKRRKALEGGGQNSTLLTKSMISSKAHHCVERWVGGQQIDANHPRRWRVGVRNR